MPRPVAFEREREREGERERASREPEPEPIDRATTMVMKIWASARVTFRASLFLFPHPAHERVTRSTRCSTSSSASYLVFQVRYAPKVSLRIRSGLGKNGRIVEGSELRFKCRAEANPPNVEYRWVENARVTRPPGCLCIPVYFSLCSSVPRLPRGANDSPLMIDTLRERSSNLERCCCMRPGVDVGGFTVACTSTIGRWVHDERGILQKRSFLDRSCCTYS